MRICTILALFQYTQASDLSAYCMHSLHCALTYADLKESIEWITAQGGHVCHRNRKVIISIYVVWYGTENGRDIWMIEQDQLWLCEKHSVSRVILPRFCTGLNANFSSAYNTYTRCRSYPLPESITPQSPRERRLFKIKSKTRTL